MAPRRTRRFISIRSIVVLTVALCSGLPLAAEEFADTEPFARLQPEIVVVREAGLSEGQARTADLLVASLRAQRRYVILTDPAFVGETELTLSIAAGRSPATATVDLARDGTSLWSGAVGPTDAERPLASLVEEIDAATAGIGAALGGFARVRFAPLGSDRPYHVFVNGEYVAASPDELGLPAGTWEIEIRRRNGTFEHPVGATTLDLAPDAFVEIAFPLPARTPPVPALLRYADPEDRFNAVLDLTTTALFPLIVGEGGAPEGVGAIASALFNNVPTRPVIVGVDVLSAWFGFGGSETAAPSGAIVTAALAGIGASVGPLSGGDFSVRLAGGAGVVDSEVPSPDGSYPLRGETLDGASIVPMAGLMTQFGVGVGRWGRVSLTTHVIGAMAGDSVLLWFALGGGVGGRF